MKIRLFYHSLRSDWNHGNAHFLRGVAWTLQAQGDDVLVLEPAEGWSITNLIAEHGEAPLRRFTEVYPGLRSTTYEPERGDFEAEVVDADLVIVHEWTDPGVVARLGELRRRHRFVLLFHDTHHRLATQPAEIARLDLSAYDGVLAYGRALRDLYLARGITRRAWTWHEAADTRLFTPQRSLTPQHDLVWIGNWGDEERSDELNEFLIEPVRTLGLDACLYGVRYPEAARSALARAGISYRGWAPNFEVPVIFARHRLTVHVPRRPYIEDLPGIPTIRPFEALACGLPLVCARWEDRENLFDVGHDHLRVSDGAQMRRALAHLLAHPERRRHLAANGLRTIRTRHTCVHRVEELRQIHAFLRPGEALAPPTRRAATPSLSHQAATGG